VGGYYSVLLYKNLRTDLEELLPTTARAVIDMDEVTKRLDSIDNLAILIMTKNAEAGRRFSDDLARELQKAPRDVIASVEYRINKELQFFKDRRTLYIELGDLIRIRNYIRDRIEYERMIHNPLNIFSGQSIPEPALDFKALLKKYEGKVSAYSRFPDGYYATPDGTKRVVIANLPGKTSGIKQVTVLKDFAAAAVQRLDPGSYSPDMAIHYAGGVQNVIEEQSAFVKDLEVSTIIVIVIVSLGMIVFFRSVFSTIALVLSLFMGTLWTFGIAYFAIGYLNANTAFLGAIIIGNGINFGIIMLARFLEEKRNNHPGNEAIGISISSTATSTWIAAIAAGLSYGSLMLTGFRGFNQFGFIGLTGMVLCWISAFTTLPALLVLFDRWGLIKATAANKPRAVVAEAAAKFISRHATAIWIISFAVTVIALFSFNRYTTGILETNLTNLRSKKSIESGSVYYSQYVDEIFQRYLSPLALLPRSRGEARQIAARLKELKEKQGPRSPITSVQTIDDFVPEQQLQKIAIMREIIELLPERFLVKLSPQDRKLVGEFLNEKTMRPFGERELPQLILGKFTEKDGSIGKLVLVEPPLESTYWPGKQLFRFINQVRRTADNVAPGTPVAGSLPVASDILSSVMRDGPFATFLAFCAVIILVFLLFRNIRTSMLVLFSLLVGITWFAGAIFTFGLKINFMNFIALPITFGIGIDYGVNIFQRYRLEGSQSILKVIRDTGGAVALCSFTTIVGYGSLLIAENKAFVSFGLLAVLGELTCVTAAIFSLPAYLIVRDRKKNAA